MLRYSNYSKVRDKTILTLFEILLNIKDEVHKLVCQGGSRKCEDIDFVWPKGQGRKKKPLFTRRNIYSTKQ